MKMGRNEVVDASQTPKALACGGGVTSNLEGGATKSQSIAASSAGIKSTLTQANQPF